MKQESEERPPAVRLLALVTLGFAARRAHDLWLFVLSEDWLPQWDMANYGAAGVELTAALKRLDLAAFAVRLSEMDLWPPLFPLLQVPALLFASYDYRVPRLLVVVLYGVMVVATYWTGLQIDRKTGALVGSLAASLILLAPFYQVFGVLVMLEIPGALLTVLALGSYLRARHLGSVGAYRLAALCATLLFFCKYNYGLIWLAAIAGAEIWSRFGGTRLAWQAFRRKLVTIDWRRPWNLFVLVHSGFLLAILLTGGGVWEVAGRQIKVTSVGNPAFLLLLLFLLRFLLRPRRNWSRWRETLQRMGKPWPTYAAWIAAPILVWMLIPGHTKNFFGFVENRSSGLPFWSMENLLFYPRSFVQDYSPHWVVGAIVVLLGCLPLVFLPALRESRRVLSLALLAAGVAVCLHPYKQPRFLFTVAPLLWLSAAASISWLMDRATSRWRVSLRQSALALAAVACLCTAALLPADRADLWTEVEWRSVPAEVWEPLDSIVDAAKAEEELWVFGVWNGLSPGLLQWHARIVDPA